MNCFDPRCRRRILRYNGSYNPCTFPCCYNGRLWRPWWVASGSWWKLPMAVISGGDVIGLCDQIKNLLGRGDIQGPPAVDFAQRDLPADQQRPEQHASGIRAGQHALGLDAPLELLVQPLDGVGGADGLPL